MNFEKEFNDELEILNDSIDNMIELLVAAYAVGVYGLALIYL